MDLPVSVGSGDVEADDFWFLDTIDDGEPFSSSDVSEVVGSSEPLGIPGEPFSPSDAPEVVGSSEPLSIPVRRALSFFKECCQKYIFCLEQVAELERLLWQEVKQPEYCTNATKFYKECAYAATCIPLDPVLGEHALRAGLALYQESGELGEAEAFYETYRRRMFKAQAYWSPEEETRALLAELLLVEEEE